MVRNMGSASVQGEQRDTAAKNWSDIGAAAQVWADLQEPQHRPVWEAMLDAGKVKEGIRVLDAGCGGGGASALAAQRGACVIGLDISDALIAIAKERVSNGKFLVGDLEELPYEGKAFDAIIAAMSVQATTNPIIALRELRRVCDSSGNLVICTWGLPEKCDQRVVFKVLRDFLPLAPAGGGPFSLSPEGMLENLVEQAGWNVIGSIDVDCSFEYPNLETHWQAQTSGGPFQAVLRKINEIELRGALDDAIKPFQTSTGGVRLQNRFRLVTALA